MSDSEVVLEREEVDVIDEERIERMLELEEELVEEQRKHRNDDEDDEEAGDSTPPSSGQIRVVEKDSDGRVRVEFYVDGEVANDTLELPDDPADPDEELNRLCRLCDVEPGHVSELQGERVPISEGYRDGEYDLCIPESSHPAGLAIFRVWWWLQRRGAPTGYAKYTEHAVKGVVAAVLWVIGIRAAWAFVQTSGDDTADAVLSLMIHGEPDVMTGLHWEFVGLIMGIWGIIVALVTAAAVVAAGYHVTMRGKQWFERDIWPF